MNGKRWFFRRWAALVLAMALLAGSARAGETFWMEDSVCGDPAWRVFDLAGDGEYPETFSYGVPEGGAAALIFFKNGCWNCANLFRGLDVLTKDPRLSVTAVSLGDREETESFAGSCIGDKLERVYYQPASYWNPGWAYVDLLYGGGGLSMGTAFALLVTEEDGVNVIRWAGTSLSDARTVREAADAILGGAQEPPETPGETVTVEILSPEREGETVSFSAGAVNQSGGDLSGRLYAAGYDGGRLADLRSLPLELPAGKAAVKSFSVRGETARLFFLDGSFRPLAGSPEA